MFVPKAWEHTQGQVGSPPGRSQRVVFLYGRSSSELGGDLRKMPGDLQRRVAWQSVQTGRVLQQRTWPVLFHRGEIWIHLVPSYYRTAPSGHPYVRAISVPFGLSDYRTLSRFCFTEARYGSLYLYLHSNGHLSRWTWVSRYQNAWILSELRVMEVVVTA